MEFETTHAKAGSKQDPVGQANLESSPLSINDYKQAYEVSMMLGDAWYQAARAARK
jgi:hypothetical protein